MTELKVVWFQRIREGAKFGDARFKIALVLNPETQRPTGEMRAVIYRAYEPELPICQLPMREMDTVWPALKMAWDEERAAIRRARQEEAAHA